MENGEESHFWWERNTRERDCDYQSIALREESKVSSTDWPQQSSDLFSVQASVTRGGGEGNSHSHLICRIFRESHLQDFQREYVILSFRIKSGSCQPMF